ncbi:MAG: UDP-3-O-acyl-N-acetylglucosamine deacetylase [Pseudomonadota bacterium]
MQTTLAKTVQFVGMGLHSGRPVRITLRPACADSGARFRRVDITDRDNIVPARFDAVSDTRLNTRLSNAVGVSVSTVEHLMAAITGAGLRNVLIDIDGPEVPIMDGSARRFLAEIAEAGLVAQSAPLHVLRVTKDVRHVEASAEVRIAPHDGLRISFEIDFADAAIGHQAASFDLANGTFARELAECRTFCRRTDIDQMRAVGLALGGTLENAVVVDGETVLNPEGFRRADECVRHKILDVVGDIALVGMPILGHYTGIRAGHGPTNRMLRTLLATPSAYRIETCTPEMAAALPGAGLRVEDLAAAG